MPFHVAAASQPLHEPHVQGAAWKVPPLLPHPFNLLGLEELLGASQKALSSPSPSPVFVKHGSTRGVAALLVPCQGHCDLEKALTWTECPVLEDRR